MKASNPGGSGKAQRLPEASRGHASRQTLLWVWAEEHCLCPLACSHDDGRGVVLRALRGVGGGAGGTLGGVGGGGLWTGYGREVPTASYEVLSEELLPLLEVLGGVLLLLLLLLVLGVVAGEGGVRRPPGG